MNTIYMCGKRGLGDIVCTISYILDYISKDSHIIFLYPPNHGYEEKIPIIINEYTPTDYNVTYEVSSEWYSVNYDKAKIKFQNLQQGKDWFFSGSIGGKLRPFKTQWKKNVNGPIGLCLNNENTNSGYPMPGKWFEPKLNQVLNELIDEKNYVTFGRMFSISECINKLSLCRYVIGVDGAWAHICNAMRVPYYLTTNGYSENHYYHFFNKHPTLKYIPPEKVFEYCVL